MALSSPLFFLLNISFRLPIMQTESGVHRVGRRKRKDRQEGLILLFSCCVPEVFRYFVTLRSS